MNDKSFCSYCHPERERRIFDKILRHFVPQNDQRIISMTFTIGIEKMLRMYLLQSWFNLSDEGIEDAIYDSYAFRKFMGIDFNNEQVPDATTLLKFRHLLKKNHIGELFFDAIKKCLDKAGVMMKGGTIVDATLISAPSSTKNQEKARDPEMHQTKKGNQWYFGMKCHAGVDAGTEYVHTITATPANVHDINETHNLLREDDEVMYGDSGYLGVEKREEIAGDEHLSKIDYRITRRPSSLPKVSDNAIDWEKYIDYRKSSVRSKVEHIFHIIKNRFGFKDVGVLWLWFGWRTFSDDIREFVLVFLVVWKACKEFFGMFEWKYIDCASS